VGTLYTRDAAVLAVGGTKQGKDLWEQARLEELAESARPPAR
jgi:hypothetical protein